MKNLNRTSLNVLVPTYEKLLADKLRLSASKRENLSWDEYLLKKIGGKNSNRRKKSTKPMEDA